MFLRVLCEGLLEGFAVELELLRLGLELPPAGLELVGGGVPHASVDELLPPVDLVAAHVLLAVPERGGLDFQVILGELEAVVRHFARLGVFELVPQVIVKVGEPLFLELDGQIPDDLGLVHPHVPHGFDHRQHEGGRGIPVRLCLDVAELLEHGYGGGKDDIGELCGLRSVGRNVGEERKLLECLLPPVRAGAGEGEVVHIPDGDLNLIGVLGEHRVGGVVGDDSAAGFSLVQRGELLVTPLVYLLHLGVFLREVVLIFSELGNLRDRYLGGGKRSSLVIHRSEEAAQCVYGHGAVPASHVHRSARTHPNGNVGGGLGHTPGDPDDLLTGNQGYPLSPLGRLVLQFEVPPFHEAVRILLLEGGLVDGLSSSEEVLAVLEVSHELLAPEALSEDDVCNRAGQGTVSAGLDRKPLVGLRRGGIQSRVNDGHGGPIEEVPEPRNHGRYHPVAAYGVTAPYEHVLGIAQVVIPVTPVRCGVI